MSMPAYRRPFPPKKLHCVRGKDRCRACWAMWTFDLTMAELRIIALLLNGLSNQQMEPFLHCGQATIKRHMFNICEKTGADHRIGIVTWAIYHGLDWRSFKPKTTEEQLYDLERVYSAQRYELLMRGVA